MNGKINKARQKTSALWSYFTPISDSVATCNTCNCKMIYRSSTNNLRTHIVRKHPFLSEGVKAQAVRSISSKRQKSIKLKPKSNYQSSSSLADSEKLPVGSQENVSACNFSIDNIYSLPQSDPSTAQTTRTTNTPGVQGCSLQGMTRKCYAHLMNFFIKNFHSFKMLEEKEFKELIKLLNPTFQLPPKSLISKVELPELYKKCLEAAKELIKTGEIFCISLESWSSVNLDNFLTVTAHFVDDSFSRQAILLDCLTVLSERNSNSLASDIKKVALDWGIEEKIQFTVSENDEDLRSAISDVLGYEYFVCFGDTINTIVRDSIQNEVVLKAIEKISQSISYIKMNSELYENIKSKQKESGETNIGLTSLSDIHCFRSIYYMLDKYTKLECVIKDELKDNKNAPHLTEQEWKIADEIRQVFKPFEYVIKTISKDKYCAASLVIPIANGLCNVCDTLIEKQFVDPVKNAVDNIKKSLSDSLGNIEVSATLSVCTFLDPRFKQFAFTSKAAETRAKELVISALETSFSEKSCGSNSEQTKQNVEEELLVWHVFDQAVNESRDSAEQSNKKTDEEVSLWSSFDNTIALKKPKLSFSSRASAEVQRYTEADMLPRNEDPLLWWKENSKLFPQLSILARSQLCAVSTSVPNERLFTKVGFTLNERRSNISAKNTKMIVFLNANMHVLQ